MTHTQSDKVDLPQYMLRVLDNLFPLWINKGSKTFKPIRIGIIAFLVQTIVDRGRGTVHQDVSGIEDILISYCNNKIICHVENGSIHAYVNTNPGMTMQEIIKALGGRECKAHKVKRQNGENPKKSICAYSLDESTVELLKLMHNMPNNGKHFKLNEVSAVSTNLQVETPRNQFNPSITSSSSLAILESNNAITVEQSSCERPSYIEKQPSNDVMDEENFPETRWKKMDQDNYMTQLVDKPGLRTLPNEDNITVVQDNENAIVTEVDDVPEITPELNDGLDNMLQDFDMYGPPQSSEETQQVGPYMPSNQLSRNVIHPTQIEYQSLQLRIHQQAEISSKVELEVKKEETHIAEIRQATVEVEQAGMTERAKLELDSKKLDHEYRMAQLPGFKKEDAKKKRRDSESGKKESKKKRRASEGDANMFQRYLNVDGGHMDQSNVNGLKMSSVLDPTLLSSSSVEFEE